MALLWNPHMRCSLFALVIIGSLLFSGCETSPNRNARVILPQIPNDLQFKPAHDPELGSYFIVTGTAPARFPEPEREFSAAFICGEQWREVNSDSRERFNIFNNWADSAKVDRNSDGLVYEDIKVSCEAGGAFRIESDTFPRTLALLTDIWVGKEKLSRGVVEEKDEIQFYSSGHELAVKITPTMIIGDYGDPPILEAQGMALAQQGDLQGPLFFDGKTSNFEYDPTRSVEVIVERHPDYGEPLGFWDILKINYNQGWLEWKQTRTRPF